MRWRGDGQQINDGTFVGAAHLHVQRPLVVRRPVPVKKIPVVAAVPIPFYRFPKLRNALGNGLLVSICLVKVLPCSQQSLHQKSRLHQIAAIVEVAERNHLSRVAIEPVRPHPMKTVGVFEESEYFFHARHSLIACYKLAFYPYQQRHDAKTAAATGHNIAGGIAFTRHP